jgi:hypothetical protein
MKIFSALSWDSTKPVRSISQYNINFMISHNSMSQTCQVSYLELPAHLYRKVDQPVLLPGLTKPDGLSSPRQSPWTGDQPIHVPDLTGFQNLSGLTLPGPNGEEVKLLGSSGRSPTGRYADGTRWSQAERRSAAAQKTLVSYQDRAFTRGLFRHAERSSK